LRANVVAVIERNRAIVLKTHHRFDVRGTTFQRAPFVFDRIAGTQDRGFV